MGVIHFFTEPSKVSQLAAQTFGPTSESEYRLTSSFSLTSGNANAKVFAPFPCHIMVVDQIDNNQAVVADYVNIVLIPIGTTHLGFTPDISYIILRRIKRNSFMVSSGSNYVLLDSATVAASGTDFMKRLYNNISNPDTSYLFYEPYTPINKDDLLYEKTFRTANPKNMFPASKGMEIGIFDSELGIDVVLHDWSKFHPTHHYAALEEYKIDLTGLASYIPGQNPSSESPEVRAKRESILAFIDPAAYYSMQFLNGVEYTNTSGQIVEVTEVDDDLHDVIIANFFTKNRIYIDIRNNNDSSLNFYDDNVDANHDNFLVSINGSVHNAESFYTLNWPIFIKDSTNPNANKNYVDFSLIFYTNYNPEPLLYQDYVFGVKSNYKINANTVKNFNLPVGINKFIDLKDTNIQSLPFEFQTRGLNNVTQSTCNYVKFYLLRTKKSAVNLPSRAVVGELSFDNIFGFITEKGIAGLDFTKLYLPINETFQGPPISKKFIPAAGNWNKYHRMVQTSFMYSNDSVIFYAADVDRIGDYANEFSFGNNVENNAKEFSGGFIRSSESLEAEKKKRDLELIQIQFIPAVQDNVIVVNQNFDFNNRASNDRDFVFYLTLTKLEYEYIQEIVNRCTNNPNANYDLNPAFHTISLGFDTHTRETHDGLFYGKARLVLQGIDANGVFKTIDKLSYPDPNSLGQNVTTPSQFDFPGNNLFVTSLDAKTISSIRYAESIGSNFNIESRDPNRGVIAILDFINYIQEIESKIQFANEDVDVTITRLRRYYYGIYDYNTRLEIKSTGVIRRKLDPKGVATQIGLEWAIPNAPNTGSGLVELQTDPNNYGFVPIIDREVFDKLLQRADENAIRDNPSPYIQDFSGKLIDVGHLLYVLDGLIHNYETIGHQYHRFAIKNSNIFTGSIADVFIPAAEARIYINDKADKIEAFYYPESLDYERLYEISAPEADILSDVDPFGLYDVYEYFITGNNSFPGNAPKKLSSVLAYFYNDTYVPVGNQPLTYKKRWTAFSKPYYTKDTSLPPNALVHQGFTNETTGVWEADPVLNPNHPSIVLLRKKAEVFSHFWYQRVFSPEVTFLFLWRGILKERLTNESQNIQGVRFEIPGQLNDDLEDADLTDVIGTTTDNTEVDYYINEFLTYAKLQFDDEQ